MFPHSDRGTLVWLFVVGLALGLTLLAGDVSTEVGAVLLAAYLGLVLMGTRGLSFGAALDSWKALTSRDKEPTEVAREAMARARGLAHYDALVRLLDVGLIVDEQRPDGMSLRRGRFISLDDDGVRPFAIVLVPGALGQRLGRVRFELRDEAGTVHYAFEDEKWLQAGENVLLPDYRFPIRKKAGELEAGGWTLQVWVDGHVLGVHSFTLGPSLAERRRQVAADGEILRERVWRSGDEDDESLPLSLEELLREQSRQHRRA